MKTEQITKLTELATELKTFAAIPKNAKRYATLLFLADACTLLAMGDKIGAEKLVELVNVKGDKVIENAMLKFLKILLEIA